MRDERVRGRTGATCRLGHVGLSPPRGAAAHRRAERPSRGAAVHRRAERHPAPGMRAAVPSDPQPRACAVSC
eukprot:353350-Chlamydomonas_euryale.AAC.17